jgi:hypothetical protein
MADISLTLLCGPEERVTVRLDLGNGPHTAETTGPSHELIADLLGQLRSSRMAGAAARHLSEVLGRVLFAGEPGEALRAALRDDPEPMVLLATDPRLADWPWELARDPESAAPLALEAAMLVREAGAPATRRAAARRAVLVVPGEHALAHTGTLQAATRPLGRKLGVDVFPLEPVTGPGLRRSLARGALFVHIEAALHGDALVLDDGHVPVERVGLDADTWLVVLGGSEVTLPLHGRLRALGVPLVLGLQISLEPAAAAALDRELYRALAAGESLGEAVRRARRALVRFGGLEGHAWAAPVLWSAPSVRGVGSPAAMPFPPPDAAEERRDPGATMMDLQTIRSPGAPASVPPAPVGPSSPMRGPAMDSAGGPVGVPLSAPAFIQDTIRCMREARPDAEVALRIDALRTLGGAAMIGAQSPELNDLSPSERTTRLADRLVETISRPDAELNTPSEFDARIQVAARTLGVSVEGLDLMARAVLAGRGLVVSGGEVSHRRRLLRTLAEDIFEAAPLTARTDDLALLVGGPGEAGFGGWIYEAIAMNWRRDDLDPYRLDAAGPTQRVPVVLRGAGGRFRVLRGVWSIAEVDPLQHGAALRDLLVALDEGYLAGVAGGRLFRLRLPADFRLLLSVDDATGLRSLLPASVPVFSSVDASPLSESRSMSERERWLGESEARFGHAADVAESQARLRVAERLAQVYGALLAAGSPVPPSAFGAAMALALQLTGEPDDRVERALVVHVAPWVRRAEAVGLDLPRFEAATRT